MFNKRQKYFIHMEEKDVTTFLSGLQNAGVLRIKCVLHDLDDWFVEFEATKKEYKKVVIELCKIGTLTIKESYKIDEADTYFTKK